MFEIREKPRLVERALLIGTYTDNQRKEEALDLLTELRELVSTLGIQVIDAVLARVGKINARYLTGKGKAHELIELARELECDCIVFDNELTPAQQRNWESESGICVIDRQEVILDIFAERAQTREARIQVGLARMQYSLPRLTRMWAHFGRMGARAGGASGSRGEGETQLEVDRRIARRKIDKLTRALEEVKKQRNTQRKERTRHPIPHAAIVGYTNAGKSSLLNLLSKSTVLVADKLFATLDTTTRKMELSDGQSLLLTDTVGFVRKLPHRLIESFKATLEEAVLADFLLHVLDASHPHIDQFYYTTKEVLEELGAHEKNTLVVLNKIDLLTDPIRYRELEDTFPEAVFISVKTGKGIDSLLHRINAMLLDRVTHLDLCIPQSRMDLVALIHREGKIIHQEYQENDLLIRAIIPRSLENKFATFKNSS